MVVIGGYNRVSFKPIELPSSWKIEDLHTNPTKKQNVLCWESSYDGQRYDLTCPTEITYF